MVHVQYDAGTKATQIGGSPAISIAKLLLRVGARTADEIDRMDLFLRKVIRPAAGRHAGDEIRGDRP
jgi:hypothetical protein